VLKESAKNKPPHGVVALPNRGMRLILMFGLLASSAPSSPQDSKPDSIVDDFSSMAGVIQLACIDGKSVLRNEIIFSSSWTRTNLSAGLFIGPLSKPRRASLPLSRSMFISQSMKQVVCSALA
jgi:hypothetical protein